MERAAPLTWTPRTARVEAKRFGVTGARNRTAPEQGGHGTALPATIAGQGLTWIGLAGETCRLIGTQAKPQGVGFML